MMSLDGFIEKWSEVSARNAGFTGTAHYKSLLRALKENSIRQKVADVSTSTLLELDLNGNKPAMKNCRIDDQSLHILVEALGEMGSGASVVMRLRYNSITDAGVEHLCVYLKKNSCPLLSLDLAYNDITEDGAEKLSHSLQLNRSLQVLSLEGNKIGRQGGLQVASMLQVNQSLQSLDLSSTDASTDVVIAVATVLHGNRYLEHLNLSSPLLHSRGEETTVHLAEMLRVNSTLTALHLSKHSMTDSGLEVLCKCLKENTTLQHLNLSCNKFSRDGAKMLANLLRGNSPIKVLDLSCNCIEDEGIEDLGNAILSSNITLRKLYVGYNGISDAGLARFAQTIENSFVLTHLSVWGNKTGIEASKAFQNLLQSGRLNQSEIDVQPYVVDDAVYLAKMDIPPAVDS